VVCRAKEGKINKKVTNKKGRSCPKNSRWGQKTDWWGAWVQRIKLGGGERRSQKSNQKKAASTHQKQIRRTRCIQGRLKKRNDQMVPTVHPLLKKRYKPTVRFRRLKHVVVGCLGGGFSSKSPRICQGLKKTPNNAGCMKQSLVFPIGGKL